MDNLRSCAGCSAHILTIDNSDMVFCPKCHPEYDLPVDASVDATVFVQPGVDHPIWLRSRYVVRGRDGDRVWLSVLGFPDRLVETTTHQLVARCVAPRAWVA